MTDQLPTLLTCGFCSEKHLSMQCPNVDMVRLLELGRLEIAKVRLMREGVQFEEWAGENEDGWWYFVRAEGATCETVAKRDRIDALWTAIRLASMAQARAEASKEKSR
jgi:hypothetical protein